MRYQVRKTSVRELVNELRARGSILESEWLAFGGRPLREDGIFDCSLQDALNAVAIGRVYLMPRMLGGMPTYVVSSSSRNV